MQNRSILMSLISIMVTSFSLIAPATARSIAQRIGAQTSIQLAQAEDPERERRLQQQREAERALQEAERLRREIRGITGKIGFSF
jgi:predicted HAD superfamily phosphohydrolase